MGVRAHLRQQQHECPAAPRSPPSFLSAEARGRPRAHHPEIDEINTCLGSDAPDPLRGNMGASVSCGHLCLPACLPERMMVSGKTARSGSKAVGLLTLFPWPTAQGGAAGRGDLRVAVMYLTALSDSPIFWLPWDSPMRTNNFE